MKQVKNEKRVLKGYKIKDSIYRKAMKRAKKEKLPLATAIEQLVTAYAEGVVLISSPDVLIQPLK